ncbi:transporter [Mesorhizobium sp. VNQ89]|uniref:transporter n=1 Tax=Mesorhizobium quangtriensis TaxID=3157709 RepID=UPI0032B7D60A
MPSGEQIQQYLTGAWQMMLGKADGLKLLDISADGFWNSFYAMLIALPALVVGWVGFANDLSALGDGFDGRLSIVLRLATIDLAAWVVPLLVLAAVAKPAGIADRFVHLVVASNWASALIAWIILPPALIGLVLPEVRPLEDMLSLVFFVAAMVLTWRMTNAALGKGAGVASAVFAGMFIVSLLTLFILQSAFGLAPLDQASGL